MDEQSRLREENERLRQDNEKLRKQVEDGGGKKKMSGCAVAALVCVGLLIVGIPMVAVLAAVAVPMYATFKQKTVMGEDLMHINTLRDGLVQTYRLDGAFPASFETIEQVNETYGTALSVDGRDYRYLSQGPRAEFVTTYLAGSGIPDGTTVRLRIDCGSDPCDYTVTEDLDLDMGHSGTVP